MTATAITCCRVRIVNHVTNQNDVVEFSRDQALVWLDVVRLVRRVNRRRADGFRASAHLTPSMIAIHFHWQSRSNRQFSKEARKEAGNLETIVCDYLNPGRIKA